MSELETLSQLILFVEESPASQQVEPGSREARQITAGSGRKLCELFPNSTPLGRFSRILLESETWASPEFYLKWKISATKEGSLIFRLAPSAPRKLGKGISSWATATTRDGKGGADWKNRQRDGKPRPMSDMTLPDQIKASWPTPKSIESGPDYAIAEREKSGGCSLPTLATWGTPQSASGNPAAHNQINGEWYFPARGPLTSGCLARTQKFVVRLMTLSAWLMGFTAHYLRHWETASARRSSKKSAVQF